MEYPARQNVFEEIGQPLDERRNVEVLNPCFFTRDPTTKRLRVMPRVKKYGLVFDKRVVDPVTFQSFPYGYRPLNYDEQDLANTELLMELQ